MKIKTGMMRTPLFTVSLYVFNAVGKLMLTSCAQNTSSAAKLGTTVRVCYFNTSMVLTLYLCHKVAVSLHKDIRKPKLESEIYLLLYHFNMPRLQ
jgi:hypothetical protein